jgi:hypothetical protein
MKNYTLEEAKNILRSEGWTPNPYDFLKVLMLIFQSKQFQEPVLAMKYWTRG